MLKPQSSHPKSHQRRALLGSGIHLLKIRSAIARRLGAVSHGVMPALLVVAGGVFLSVGCGGTGDENAPPPFTSMGGQLGFGGVIIGGCDGDETLERNCTVYITQASGVTSCFSGIQYCDDGEWSDCVSSDHDPRVE